MPGTKVVITGDATSAVAAAQKVGDTLKSAGKHALSVGDNLSSSIERSITKSLAKFELMKRAVGAVGNAVNEMASKAEAASQARGERAINMATALNKLGVTQVDKTMSELERAGGSSSIAERTSFVESLASQQGGSRFKAKPEEIQAAIAAYSQGGNLTYGKGGEELLAGIARGKPIEQITRESELARPGLFSLSTNTGGAVATELSIRDVERRAQLRAEASRAPAGQQGRLGGAILDAVNAKDAATDIKSTIAFQAPGVKAAADLAAGKNNDVGAAFDRALDRQTKAIRPKFTPNYSAKGPQQ